MYTIVYEITRNGVPFNLTYTDKAQAEATITALEAVDSEGLYAVYEIVV